MSEEQQLESGQGESRGINVTVPRPLPLSFTWSGDGFVSDPRELKQLVRNQKAAIYSRGIAKTGKLEGFEVIKIRTRSGVLPNGKATGLYEVYPSAREFGTYAKACSTLESAEWWFKQWSK